MRLVECDQYSEEWYAARAGVPSASNFGKVITPGGKPSASAEGYMGTLIDEIVRPDAMRGFSGNEHTERGNELEPKARNWYAFVTGQRVRQVGFVTNDAGTLGCSPDLLILNKIDDTIGDTVAGGAEIKAPDGPTQACYLADGGLPEKYKAQVHGSLVVTGLPWWDFVSYCPGYRTLRIRVKRDEYTDLVAKVLEKFIGDYAKARAKVLA